MATAVCYETDKHIQSHLSQNPFYFTILYSSIVLKDLKFSSSVSRCGMVDLFYGLLSHTNPGLAQSIGFKTSIRKQNKQAKNGIS